MSNAISPSDPNRPSAPTPARPSYFAHAASFPLLFPFGGASARAPEPDPLQDASASANIAVDEAARAQRARQLAFLEDLVRNLDIFVYAQLSAGYYMDPSLLRLIVRLLPHWLFFTPKPLPVKYPNPPHLYFMLLVVPCFGCLLAHVLEPAPSAGEAVRGYLHGGLFIDFVGELGPVSKWRLILGDLVVLAIQFILIGLEAEVEKVEGVGSRRLGTNRVEEVVGEEEGLGKDGGEGGKREQHPLDKFYGGQSVVADVRLVDAMNRTLWWRDTPG